MWRLMVMVVLGAVVLGVMSGLGSRNSAAQTPPSPRDVADQLLSSPQVPESLFDASLLSQVSASQVQGVLDRLRQSLGVYQGIDGTSSPFTARFDKGTLPVTIALNSRGLITGLLAGTPSFADKAAGYAQAVQQIEQLPGRVSLLVTKDGKDQTAFDADDKLAVGSAFKLAVLRAAKDQLDANRVAWDDVYNLKPGWQSLSSGVLQTWPVGSALTLQTIASLMISQSDNTAADGMIDIVGKDAVEKYGGMNKPFLTTREAFVLKSDANSDLRQQYLQGNAAEKAEALQLSEGRPLPSVTEIATTGGRQIEWFYDTRQLCGMIGAVADSPVMRINPGVADTAKWRQVAFKGGSDDGVINLTQQMVEADGTKWCVAMTWNGDDVKEDTLTTLGRTLIANLGQ